MQPVGAIVLGLLLATVCGSCSHQPATPTGPSVSTAPPSEVGNPGGSGGTFSIRMPIALADSAHSAYGLWPYGVQGGGHASDGHPGWDVEYRPGAPALAAADGTVDSIVAAISTPGAVAVQLTHVVGGRTYRTVYQNIGTLAAGIVVGARVSAGQALGVPVTQTLMMGQSTVTFAMIHFQVDDFSSPPGGLTNPDAVGPDTFLEAGAVPVFGAIWSTATYNQELCEPFPSNPRNTPFPSTRSWQRSGGVGPARVEFTRLDITTSDYVYQLFDDQDRLIERGMLQVSAGGGPPTGATLRPDGGKPSRPALYDVVGDVMSLSIGERGAVPPLTLGAAAVYRTTR